MKSLQILFICPYLPSLIRVRPYNLLKYLSKRGHKITLLALIPPGEDTSSLETLRKWCCNVETIPLYRWRTLWNGLKAIPSRTPFQAAYARSPAMTKLIRQRQAELQFDVVHVEHLRGAEFGQDVTGTPIVFDSVDSITLLFEHVVHSGPTRGGRLLAKLDLGRTRRYEGQLPERYPRVLVTSPKDKNALAKLSVGQNTDERFVVLPNGVDLDYFKPLDLPRDPATVIFSGKMSYHANVAAALDLATEIMPHVWQQLPEAKLVIAGKDPTPELLALGEDQRIIITGTVPDLRPYLAQATVAVTPMRYGVGIQNKVLEAMAMGTPVITTCQTTTALQVQAEKDLLVADTPQAIAEKIVVLLTDNELRQRIGLAGRYYVETYHDWEATAGKLEAIYREIISETQYIQI